MVAGSIIPDEDREFLKAAGVAEVFGPGTPTSEILSFNQEQVGGLCVET